MRDVSRKTVYNLEPDDFEALFCRRCKDFGGCTRALDTVKAYQGLIDSGVWYRTNEKGN